MPHADKHLLPDRVTVDELLRRAAAKDPDRVAIVTERHRLTFAELNAAADRCAAALSGTDGAVGLAMVLDPAFATAYYGIPRSGNVVVTMNPMLRGHTLEYICRTAEVRTAFVTSAMLEELAPALDRLPQLSTIVVLDSPSHLPGTLSFDAFMDAAPTHPVTPGPTTADELACIQFTSGSTGAPKGVMLSHRNVVANAVQVAVAHGLDDSAVTVNHIPGYHLMHLNSAVYAGATQVLCRDADPATSIELANRYKADRLYSLPVRLARLAADARLPELRLETVQAVLSGGSALPGGVATTLTEHFGVPVLQGYGMAETSPLTHCDRIDRPKWDSVGYPVTGTECRVVDVEHRTALPFREKGEVQVRGPQLMLGYLGREHAAEIDEDGWFSTGDIGLIDPEGALFLTDRIKDVFKCDNELVSPTEVERVLVSHPLVADCAVVDFPDRFSGAVPFGLVVLAPSYQVADPTGALDEIVAYANAKVAVFQRLRHIRAVPEIPRTATGKIQRRTLREQVRADYPMPPAAR
ncbi:class I adenylate-forming enzyme family protein [Streptomyces rimosus]|uniref:class I adenylate-forming enzyme family protein n=1 Tax=Streptomyces rimosus TaxID=1927 RepID=UPI00067AED2D|nr:class I adenylate-forming enzyme family protein [Streptomyces rimosus]